MGIEPDDEKRVFNAGPAPGPINIKGVRIGVPVCEDIWTEESCETLAESGAELLLVPNGSPFEQKKEDLRLNLVVARVTETGLPLAYLNQVGGQDELTFDGASFVLNADRTIGAQLPAQQKTVIHIQAMLSQEIAQAMMARQLELGGDARLGRTGAQQARFGPRPQREPKRIQQD